MTRRRILLLTAVAYSVLAVAGLGWGRWQGRPWTLSHPAPWLELEWGARLLASLGAGLALALLTLLATRFLVRATRWARELHVGFRELLGGLDALSVGALALFSGVGEEIFFRGALQPSLGLLPASLLFGLLHIGPDRRFLAWTPWAIAMGLLLGLIYEATGSLAGCVLAHVTINYANLRFIAAHDPGTPNTRPPSLASREERR